MIIKNFYLGMMIEFASCDSLQYRGLLITLSDSFHLKSIMSNLSIHDIDFTQKGNIV